MKILVVNDDGIDAIGIKILENALKDYGEITVVAPERCMSATGHSITIKKCLKIDKRDNNHYAVSGTPADCVRLAVDLFGPFDVLFSGINDGLNLGTDVMYSGTVNASLEGTIARIKSCAISTDFKCFDIVNKEIDKIISYIFNNDLLTEEATLNVNFPTSDFKESKGIRFSIQGVKDFKTHFKLTENGYIEDYNIIDYDNNEKSDVYLASQGYITMTPVGKFQTDFDKYSFYVNKDIKL